MKVKYILFLIFLIHCHTAYSARHSALDAESPDTPQRSPKEIAEQARNDGENKTNFFIENKGQWNPTVRYLFQSNNYNAWITDFGIVYDYFEFENDTVNNTVSKKGDVIIMKFERDCHANARNDNTVTRGCNPLFITNHELITKYNYFFGNDPNQWATNVSLFKEVTVRNIYDGIDVKYYVDENHGNNLRYDFVLQPYANPNDIKYSFEGAKKITVNQNGELEIHTKNNIFKHTNLLAYQLVENNNQKIIFSEFVVSEISNMQIGHMQYAPTSDRRGVLHTPIDAKQSFVAFKLGEYDKSQKLIIDPLIYSVLMGSNKLEMAYGVTVDTAGSVIVVGETRSLTFPARSGSYSINYNGGNSDVFVSKIDKTGKILMFSTFLGGTKDERARYVRVDNDFNVYVVGETNSVDTILPQVSFPRLSSNPTLAATKNGWNTFVTKLSPMGNQLKFSILLGGDYNDNSGGLELIKNAEGVATAAVVAVAYSKNVTGSISDCYIAVIDSAGSQIKYEKFLAGNNRDIPKGLAVDNEKNIFVAGNTNSPNFPVSTSGFQEQLKGGDDIFVTKLDSTLSQIIFSTFIGGTKNETVSSISVDADGYAYITGTTFSSDFPTTPDAYKIGTLKADSANIFVTKFNQNGSGLEYSATITSEKQNFATGIVVDENKNAHISGHTTSADFPTTWDAFFTEYSQFGDAIYSVFDSTGSELIFSSFIGGRNGTAESFGLALDKNSAAYICGATTSQRSFPHSQIFADDTVRLDTIITVSDSILVVDTNIVWYWKPVGDTLIWSPDTTIISWYQPTKFDSTFVHRSVPNLGNWDVFIFKASYKPSPDELITNIDSKGTQFCAGDTVRGVQIIANGFYYPDNFFRIQISDANGVFPNNPDTLILAIVRANSTVSLDLYLPAYLNSDKYRIRVISTSPRSVGAASGFLDIAPPYIKLDSNEIPKQFCINEQIQIPFLTNPCFDVGNIFSLQLSDTSGSFANPTTLATANNNQNYFTVNISDTIKLSENYRIRVVSTLPQVISNVLNISVTRPLISFDNSDFSDILSLCAGDEFPFEFNATNCFATNNIFYLILSDTVGNFSNSADTLGRITSSGDFSNLIIEGKIPENIIFSEDYKMKIVSTNPQIEAIVDLNFIIGKPYIFTENLVGISICKDLETSLQLNANNCFDDGNIFEFLIKVGNNFVKIGESEPNSKTISLKVPENFIGDSATVKVSSKFPETETEEFKIKIALPEVEIVSTNPIELCEGDNFTIKFLTNGCFKDTVNITVELSKNDITFSNPDTVGTGKIFNDSGTVNAKLPDEIDEYSDYYIRFISSENLQSNIFKLEINPASVAITSEISDLEILCLGVSFYLNFETKGCFDIGNIFRIILSDATGDFSNGTVIGEILSTNSGRIFVQIPLEIADGNRYRIKITSTLPETDNSILNLNITIKKPFITIKSIGNLSDKCPPDVFNSVVSASSRHCEQTLFAWQSTVNKNRLPRYARNDGDSLVRYDSKKSSEEFQSDEDLPFVTFDASDCFNSENIFILQFGRNGDFTNPLNIDTVKNDEREFRFSLPDNLGTDSYKIRIIAGNPFTVSDTSDVDVRYNQPFAILTATGNLTVCRNMSVNFSYTTNHCFNEDNIFYLEMSDETGNFAYSTVLDFSDELFSGKFTVIIPEHFNWGKDYKLRIRSTSPVRYFLQTQLNFEIGAPEILTGNLQKIRLARNETFFVPFNTNCLEKEGRIFVVQLSDATGKFELESGTSANILNIGSQTGWQGGGNPPPPLGHIFARIPLQASDSRHYRVRVVSATFMNPEIIGKDNGKDIIIFGSISDVDATEPAVVEIFPNPFNEQLFINLPTVNIAKNITVTISDLLGIIRKQLTVADFEQIEINTVDLENGVYFVTVEFGNERFNFLVVKMKVK